MLILRFNLHHIIREKNSKVRLTGMAEGNAIGEKLPMFVINNLHKK